MRQITFASLTSIILAFAALAGCADTGPEAGGAITTTPAMTTPTPAADQPLQVFGLGIEIIETMKDPDGVPFDLTSVFAISNTFFHCVIATNDHTFTMPTAEMGNATVPKNALYMVMDSVSVDSLERINATHVEMKGKMRSITRVGPDVFEDSIIDFTAEFSDGGPGFAKDTTVLKPIYTAEASPIQKAIFGAEPHFGHGIISGDITITGGA